MKKPGSWMLTTLLTLTIYLFLTGSGWPAGLCCVGMSMSANDAGVPQDCDHPCGEAPFHQACGSAFVGNHRLIPCAGQCSFGPLAGSRHYIAAISGQQTSQRLHESAGTPSMLPSVISIVTVQRYLIPQEPSESGRDLACIRAVILVC
jgi:hypothetical protein